MLQRTSSGAGVVIGQAIPESSAGSQLRNTDGAPRDLVAHFVSAISELQGGVREACVPALSAVFGYCPRVRERRRIFDICVYYYAIGL